MRDLLLRHINDLTLLINARECNNNTLDNETDKTLVNRFIKAYLYLYSTDKLDFFMPEYKMQDIQTDVEICMNIFYNFNILYAKSVLADAKQSMQNVHETIEDELTIFYKVQNAIDYIHDFDFDIYQNLRPGYKNGLFERIGEHLNFAEKYVFLDKEMEVSCLKSKVNNYQKQDLKTFTSRHYHYDVFEKTIPYLYKATQALYTNNDIIKTERKRLIVAAKNIANLSLQIPSFDAKMALVDFDNFAKLADSQETKIHYQYLLVYSFNNLELYYGNLIDAYISEWLEEFIENSKSTIHLL